MKSATSALTAYINSSDTVVMADLYTFSLIGNISMHLVDYPLPQIVLPKANIPGSLLNTGGGNVTFTRGPKLGRSKVNTKVGLEPSELDIDVYPDSTADFIGSLTWEQFALAGGFDGGIVELDRMFIPTGSDGIEAALDVSLGGIVWFYGKIADVEFGRSSLKIKVKSYINLLQQQQMPRRIFQTGCTHIFGDTMCGYDRINGKNALGVSTGAGAANGTAVAGSTQFAIVLAGPPSAFFAQGTVNGLTGQNAGIGRGALSISGSTVNLSRPFPFPVNIGDTFQFVPGCDHTSGTCNSTFQNLLRYGGFDYIPPPEIAV